MKNPIVKLMITTSVVVLATGAYAADPAFAEQARESEAVLAQESVADPLGSELKRRVRRLPLSHR